MDRRTALFSTMALGGLLTRGQAQPPQDPPPGEPSFQPDPGGGFESPQGFDQPGHRWAVFNIARYTSLPHSADTKRPEAALVDWVFRATGSSTWHGADVAALSASRNELRAYHNPETLEKVKTVARRFLDPLFDQMSLRVRVLVAADTRWRYAVYSELEPKATGPMGQQAWLVDLDTAEAALAQMGLNQSFREVYDHRHEILNGQTLFVKVALDRNYVAALARSSNSSLGFEQKVGKLEEGVEMRLSPLLNYDGTAVDLALDLRATSVRNLHPTRVIAPRRIGPAEMSVDVPEISASRMNQTIPEWPLDRSLVISAGVLPNILEERGGWFSNVRLPGTGPGASEVLVVLDLTSRLGPEREEPEEGGTPSRATEPENTDQDAFSALEVPDGL